MAGKREEKREALRRALINAAERQIVAGGMKSVKARDLAGEVGCAVGAIYNVFDDLTALFMAVNGRTFLALGKAIAASQEGMDQAHPRAALIAMGQAYLDFAAANMNLWRALFDLEMPDDPEATGWYLKELRNLFSFIQAALVRLWPNRTDDEIEMMTRALFSSVHGMVLLGLENRFSGVPRERIGQMIAALLSEIGNE